MPREAAWRHAPGFSVRLYLAFGEVFFAHDHDVCGGGLLRAALNHRCLPTIRPGSAGHKKAPEVPDKILVRIRYPAALGHAGTGTRAYKYSSR